jgi:HK97 family phage major capsid protein
MNMTDKLRQQLAEQAAKMQAISDLAAKEDRELTEADRKDIDACLETSKVLDADLARAVAIENKVKEVLNNKKFESDSAFAPQAKAEKIPATVKRHGRLKAFKDDFQAYSAGQFLRATVGNNAAAKQWCNDNGILNVHGTTDNAKGGVLVPDGFETAIINLREEYGVFRQNARVYPMSEPIVYVPRRQSGFTAYYVGENSAGTESDASFSQVKLDAKKLMILTRLSQELNDDAIISLADFVANEMAYAFAVQEDQAGFLGDGSSTYGGIIGLENALAAGSVATAAAGDDTFEEVEFAFFQNAVGKLPRFPGIQPKWYVHNAFYWNAMVRLANAAGGNTINNVEAGPGGLSFMGYPVVLVNALPSALTTLASEVVGFFGDLSMTATMGSRSGISVVSDSSRYFEYDQIAMRCTQRYDIVCHEVGTASAAGPMIALKMGTA